MFEFSLVLDSGGKAQGFYLYGNVGSGKTLLMDLLYDAVPTEKKKRVHFNSFMIYLYSHIHKWNLCSGDTDFPGVDFISPTEYITNKILEDAWLLCFDEIQLADYASCSLLAGVFTHMLEKGAIIVGTSNRAPEELGDATISDNFDGDVDGIKETINSFKSLLMKNCNVHHLVSERDHRMEMKPGEQRFFSPMSQANEEFLDRMFYKNVMQESPTNKVHSSYVTVYGRKVIVPMCTKDIARFSFHELCERPLGPSDYIQLCNSFSTIFVDSIPKMSIMQKNEARRLLSFIDAAYESRVQLYCTAEGEPEELFQMVPREVTDRIEYEQMHYEMLGEIAYDLKLHGLDFTSLGFISGEDEIFSFRRAISRFKEMQSAFYQRTHHRPQMFQPYLGTQEERDSAIDNRKLRENRRQDRLKQLEDEQKLDGESVENQNESRHIDPDLVRRDYRETDWGDEASYTTWSQEVARKREMDSRKHRGIGERQKDVPAFGDQHFWGFGWWENMLDKIRRKDKPDK